MIIGSLIILLMARPTIGGQIAVVAVGVALGTVR